MTNASPTAQTVGSVTFIDSDISDTPIGFLTNHAANATFTNGSLVIENVSLTNVRTAVQGAGNITLLRGPASGGASFIAAWTQGHSYTPNGPTKIAGPITPFPRSPSLLQGAKIYERSKPQYADIPVTQFVSVRAAGAKGNGRTDDTAALQAILNQAANTGKIVFFNAGIYKVTRTLDIPKGSKIVGEAYPVIMSSGSYWASMKTPQPIVRVGRPGDAGCIEWSDMVVGTQGAQAGAIAIEWNLASSSASPSGMWDVHVRVGGFAGSKLQLANCPATPESSKVNEACIGAFMSMHITKSATGVYLENTWLWTADHDLDNPVFTNITVYNGRGLNVEAQKDVWL